MGVSLNLRHQVKPKTKFIVFIVVQDLVLTEGGTQTWCGLYMYI